MDMTDYAALFMPLALATPEQLVRMSEDEQVDMSRLETLSGHLQTVLSYWLAAMPPEQLQRMDSAIVERYKTSMSRDTALLTLRDYLNQNAILPVRLTVVVTDDRLAIDYTALEKTFEAHAWLDALNVVTRDNAYRVCRRCKKPFIYRRSSAVYCSDACRTAASRARRDT